MMTKKDYEAIAVILSRQYHHAASLAETSQRSARGFDIGDSWHEHYTQLAQGWRARASAISDVTHALADEFHSRNTRFNHSRFLTAASKEG